MMDNTNVQLSAEAYARAEALLMGNLKQTTLFSLQIGPGMNPHDDRFWYRVSTREGLRFMRVDPATAAVAPAFDHAAVAAQLTELAGFPLSAAALPIMRLDCLKDGEIGIHALFSRFVLDIATGVLRTDPFGGVQMNEIPSPDGRWVAFERDCDLFVRSLLDGSERRITQDGTPDRCYGRAPDTLAWSHELDALGVKFPASIVWSPDSRRFASHVLDQTGVEEMWYVASTPPADARPRMRSKRYAMPGDAVVPTSDIVVVDVESGAVTMTGAVGIPTPFLPLDMSKRLWFANGGADLMVIKTDRFERTAELLRIDPASGETRTVLTEQGATHVDFHPNMGVNNCRVDGRTVVWWSERSGWGQLYRYDLDTGALLGPITEGDWLVHTVLAVDEQAGFVWFSGAGREPGDPYRQRLYRAPLTGGRTQLLDTEDAHHQLVPTGRGAAFVDTVSTLTDFGRTVMRDRSGRIVLELEIGDSAGIDALGFRAPLRVPVTAADGVTQLWATVFLPPEAVEGVRYPVLDDIYPGPQVSKCSPSLAAGSGFMGFGEAFSLASLGFVVVQIDGRGTPGRSKAFHDHSYGAIERSSDLDDHEAAIRELARTLPLDLDRVGIFGASGGGYASARAVLTKPDFYKAAVALCGNHDQRLLSSTWGETYQGPNVGDAYATQANANYAGGLRGKLLLIHGELDDNVCAAHTLRLVDKLIEADADFEMFIVPNASHAFIGRQAFHIRRRWDFFVRHLLGMTPPAGYRLKEPPMEMWGG
jgi:dipeptidyl-peptidase-4